MVNLQDNEDYFTSLKSRIGIAKVYFFTSEADIKDVISDITPEEQPFLMVIIPSAKTNGSTQDDVTETNSTILYLLSKEDSFDKTTYELQKSLQTKFEQMKRQIIEDKDSCDLMRDLDVASMHSDPESKLFSKLSGWSVSFSYDSDL